MSNLIGHIKSLVWWCLFFGTFVYALGLYLMITDKNFRFSTLKANIAFCLFFLIALVCSCSIIFEIGPTPWASFGKLLSSK